MNRAISNGLLRIESLMEGNLFNKLSWFILEISLELMMAQRKRWTDDEINVSIIPR